jgi:sphinganine-1-phosphate aldolase
MRAGELVRDLEEAVAKEVAEPTKDKGGAAALYGMAESVPDKRIVGEMAGLYLDCLFAI